MVTEWLLSGYLMVTEWLMNGYWIRLENDSTSSSIQSALHYVK